MAKHQQKQYEQSGCQSALIDMDKTTPSQVSTRKYLQRHQVLGFKIKFQQISKKLNHVLHDHNKIKLQIKNITRKSPSVLEIKWSK